MSNEGESRFYELDKRVALLEQAQINIQKELHAISTNLNKLVWVLITTVVVGVINLWAKSGGM